MTRIVVRHNGYGIVYGSAAAQRRRAADAERERRHREAFLPRAAGGAQDIAREATSRVGVQAASVR
jgi:hypothetical protein